MLSFLPLFEVVKNKYLVRVGHGARKVESKLKIPHVRTYPTLRLCGKSDGLFQRKQGVSCTFTFLMLFVE